MNKELQKAILPILFWGLWILLIWWLMVRNDNTPDLSVPDNGIMEDVGPAGYPY